jgi:hypothetical protein
VAAVTQDRLKKLFRSVLPYYVATMALIQPLRSCYSLLKKMNAAIVPWYDILLNVFTMAWDVCYLIVVDLLKGAMIVVGVTMPLAIFAWFVGMLVGIDRKRLEDVLNTFQTWLVVICACLLFVVSIFESMVHAPEINLFTFRPMFSRWEIRQWLDALVGAAIVIPSYVYLFIVVRRWIRTTFGNQSKEPVKDLLA